jgi:hypothetical protein
MSSLFHKAFYSCKIATELIDRSQLTPLNSIQAYRLKVHLSRCKKCAKYVVESKLIDQVISNQIKRVTENPQINLDPEFLIRLKESVSSDPKKKL